MDENTLCDFGCKQKAKFLLKNGKRICEKNWMSCPINKKKYSKAALKNVKKNNGVTNLSNQGWAKGLTKKNDERVKRNAESVSSSIKEKMKNGWISPRTKWVKSDIGRKHLSEKRSDFLQNNSCQCKWFEYNNGKKDIKVQGTWEKRVVEYLIKNNIKWDRTRIFFDKVRTYTPDFYLPDLNIYIEVKGWMRDRDIKKMNKVCKEHYIDLRLIDSKKILEDLENNKKCINDLEKFEIKYRA